ncbi:MAG: hypothetical protein ACI4VF_09940 [Lachnospirales bacterium]
MDNINLNIINNKPYIIKHNARPCTKGYLFPINANKLYNKEISTLSEFLEAIKEIQTDLGISDWVINRVDFAFDSKLKYDDIYKYGLYIISLLSDITKTKNVMDTQDANTRKKRALTIKKTNFEFQIYDKALESNNKHPYCRFEFRFKNIRSNDIKSIIDRLQGYIDSLPNSIENVETQTINDIYNLWEKENQQGCSTQTRNFSEFVRRYNDNIFTRNIAKGLYNKILNGDFDSWLKWYKRSNDIKFILKSDIDNISREMKKALDIYLEKG